MCKHSRLIDVSAKCSDLCSVSYKDENMHGYVPSHIGIGGGDYVDITYCADCGQLQGTWPLPEDLTLNEDED